MATSADPQTQVVASSTPAAPPASAPGADGATDQSGGVKVAMPMAVAVSMQLTEGAAPPVATGSVVGTNGAMPTAAVITAGKPVTVAQKVGGEEGWKRKVGSRTGNYKCSKCGQPKKNHTCEEPAKEKEPKEVKNHGWRRREDLIIQEGVKLHGYKWSDIAKTLPGRTDNAVRNRWHRMERARKIREGLSAEVSVIAYAPAAAAAALAAAPAEAVTAIIAAAPAAAAALSSTPALLTATPVTAKVATLSGYKCSKCGQPKKGHLCPALMDPPAPDGAPAAAGAPASADAGMMIVGNRVVSAQEGAAADYLATLGGGAKATERPPAVAPATRKSRKEKA